MYDGIGEDSGHVRVYRCQYEKTSIGLYSFSGCFKRGANINGAAAGDQSGYFVSISSDGNTVAIGSPFHDGDSGHVRVWRWKAAISSWLILGEAIDGVVASDPKQMGYGDQSGDSVSLSGDGNTVAIAAPDNGDNGSNSGRVRVYRWNNTAWDQLGADILGEATGDYSGWSVSLSEDGTIVAIGAYLNDGNGEDSGHVRVYQWSTSANAWVKLGPDIDGEKNGDQSGGSVSLSSDGTKVAIGSTWGSAPLNSAPRANNGQVRVFDFITATCAPTKSPSPSMSSQPSELPSSAPSNIPSAEPSTLPSFAPSKSPSSTPSSAPSMVPSVSAQPTVIDPIDALGSLIDDLEVARAVTTDKKIAKSMAKAIDKIEKALKDLAKGDETKGAQDLLRAYKELGCDDAEGNGFCNAIADVMPKILITR